MGQNGVVQLAGTLDPTAQEFRPAYTFLPYFYPTTLTHQPDPFPPPVAILPPAAKVPTRAIQLSWVPPESSESELRRDLEVFGDVRAVEMRRERGEGIVTVHFYDLRAAHAALDAVRFQHMQHQHRLRQHFMAPNYHYFLSPPSPPPAPGIVSGRAVWAQFAVPATNAFPDGQNQGTIVIFNLDPNVSCSTLRNIFQSFGAVKELRETPMKKQQKFVEFYDVRDASRALFEMNGKEINGRSVMIEFSRPGGSHNSHNHNKTKLHYYNFNNLSPHFHHYPTKPRRMTSPRQRVSAGPDTRRRSPSNGGDCCSSSVEGGGGIVMANSKEERKGGKTLKGEKKKKKFDSRFMIKEDASLDIRTTVMIKNIPNKYSQKLLLNMLDNHCIHCNEQIGRAGEDQPLSSYDFLYLPIDFNNKCNVGYGFVNMTSPEATLRLYKAFHHQHWEVFNSRKICEVTYARVQGLEALKEHFKNSKFACQNDEFLPVLFSPPRDGHQLTAPIPIVLTTLLPSPTLHHDHHHVDGCDSTSSSESHHDDDDHKSSAATSNGGGDVINDDEDGCSNSSCSTGRS